MASSELLPRAARWEDPAKSVPPRAMPRRRPKLEAAAGPPRRTRSAPAPVALSGARLPAQPSPAASRVAPAGSHSHPRRCSCNTDSLSSRNRYSIGDSENLDVQK